MKLEILVLSSAFVLAGCAFQCGTGPSDSITADTRSADISPRDIPVESFVLVDVAEANARVDEAVAQGEEWPFDALSVAESFGVPTYGRYASTERVDAPAEVPNATTVTFISGSYLDDSVWGEWNQLLLSRQSDGSWRIDEARRAWRCYRGHQMESFGERWCL